MAPVHQRNCRGSSCYWAAQGWHLVPKDRSQPEPRISIPRSVAKILSEHVTLELEGIDRMYLNVYVPRLQREAGVAGFFRYHRGHRFASSVLMDPISKAFVGKLEDFAMQQKIPVVAFRKGERKCYNRRFPRFFSLGKRRRTSAPSKMGHGACRRGVSLGGIRTATSFQRSHWGRLRIGPPDVHGGAADPPKWVKVPDGRPTSE